MARAQALRNNTASSPNAANKIIPSGRSAQARPEPKRRSHDPVVNSQSILLFEEKRS